MANDAPQRRVSARIIRPGEAEPEDDWSGGSVDDRIAAVWELTRQCLAWNRALDDEPRLQRSVTRVWRAWRS